MLHSNIVDGFKTVSQSALGKGFISAYNDVIGDEFGRISDGSPDGVKGQVKRGRATLKLDEKPDHTKVRATAMDQPFTVVSSGGSQYYTDIVQSESYTPGEAEAAQNTGTAVAKQPTVPGIQRPYSMFNKYSLINYRGTTLNGSREGLESTTDGKSQYQKIPMASLVNPTVSRIIEITGDITNNMGYRYQYSDFALARYFNKIPNSMMITLRRFAYPAADDIITPQMLDTEKTDDGDDTSTDTSTTPTNTLSPKVKPGFVDIPQPDIARAVTWYGEATGNILSDILKFSHGFSWKDAESEVQTISGGATKQASSGKFGSMMQSSRILSAVGQSAKGRDAVGANRAAQSSGHDPVKDTYPNHVFGALNVIKNVLIREKGLKFEQEFSIKFEYELRSFEGANPKVMMLDQLSNLLALTYNNAPFWGGSVRHVGGGGDGPGSPLGNLNLLKSGDYAGFAGSIVSDAGKMFSAATKGFGGAVDAAMNLDAGGVMAALKDNKFLNNLIGGAAMEMFNTPQGGQAAASLLTGDPTGNWHLTIGNPLDPIAVIGNLCMTDCDITFEGGNGIQDFPERLVAVIKLKPGRPRDKAGIESMFNAGRGRFYLQPDDVADINKTSDVSAYGNKDKKATKGDFVNIFRKMSNG